MSTNLQTTVAETAVVATPPVGPGDDRHVGVLDRARPLAMLGVLVVVVIVAQILYSGFLDWTNIKLLLSQNAPVGIIAVGMTFVMIGGGFDLSVGSIYALGATVFAMLVTNGHAITVAALVALALGLSAGITNGVLASRLRINAFIATLATASMFGGAAFLLSKSTPQIPTDASFTKLGQGEWGPLPISVWLLLVVLALGTFLLAQTNYGRALYAVGGNPEAARLAGLRVDLLRTTTFALVGVLAALGGMIIASRLNVGQADIGASVPLDAIAIVVVGGTSLFGGEGAMWRTAVGILILGSLTNLFDSLSVDANVQLVAKGAILLAAVGLDAFLRSRD